MFWRPFTQQRGGGRKWNFSLLNIAIKIILEIVAIKLISLVDDDDLSYNLQYTFILLLNNILLNILLLYYY